MKTRIGIFGQKGRMGKTLLYLLETQKSVGGVEFELHDPPDIWIDFSSPEGTLELLEKAHQKILVATTGHSKAHKEKILEYSLKYPVLLAPNTSPGITWIQKSLSLLPHCKVTLKETHHIHKKDSPSGTALLLQQTLQEKGIESSIQSYREGEALGKHVLEIELFGEKITLEHKALSRELFAWGALAGASFLARQEVPRIYSMQEVF